MFGEFVVVLAAIAAGAPVAGQDGPLVVDGVFDALNGETVDGMEFAAAAVIAGRISRLPSRRLESCLWCGTDSVSRRDRFRVHLA